MELDADFEAVLLNVLASRFKARGYEYDPQLRLNDELFGFRKELDEAGCAIVQFQPRRDAAQIDFTVTLFTARADEMLQPRSYGGYAGARGARLSYVLWFVHGLRDYAVPDYWWVALDEAYLPAALEEAMGCIERYGIPWLENPAAPRPWEMPVQRADEFAEAVQSVMTAEMVRLGYRLEQQSLYGDLPYCYFSKLMPDGTFALIELQAIYSLDPGEFNFDVRLQRRVVSDPLAFNGNYGHWRSTSLAQLAWQARGESTLDRLSVVEVKSLFWRYHDRAELDAQLLDALAQIKHIGLAWVEQPLGSKMIQ
jgi:hypothetical protein